MIRIDMDDFESVLIKLMEEEYGSLEEAVRNRGEFLYTIRDNATGYLRKTYLDKTEPEEFREFMREVQMAYVKSANKIINEYTSPAEEPQKIDSRAIADF